MKAPGPFQAYRWRWKRRREHCPLPTTPSPAVIFLFFAVVFGLLVLGFYILADLISFLEIQRLQLAGSSSTVFAVNLILYHFSVHRLFAPSLRSKRLDRRNTKTVQGRSQDFSKGGRLLNRFSCRPPRAQLYYRGMKAQMKAHIN